MSVTSSTGAVGSGVTSGNGKSIIWHAGIDYSGHQQNNIQVKARARDKWQNQGDYASSTDFHWILWRLPWPLQLI